MRKILIGTSFIIFLCVIGAALYYFQHHAVTDPYSVGTTGYINDDYHFSLQDPQDLRVHVTPEGDGASTISFENMAGNRAFEIFVIPYTDSAVSDERFKLDEPSGVRDHLTTTTVGGVTASTFNGSNLALGETYEVWFIHNGFLYEAATSKDLEGWLSGILKTLKFKN